MESINIIEKFGQFTEQWTPKIIGELNDQHIKLARIQGSFIWHSHADEDELFMVFKGTLFMDFRDRSIEIRTGEMLIVPRGVEHCPRTKDDEEVFVLLFEPKTTTHTGEVEHERTVKELAWI